MSSEDDLFAKLELLNEDYFRFLTHQLEEWIKGNSIHNPNNLFVAVLDEDGELAQYSVLPGGACCPDLSCHGGEPWPVEERIRFQKFFLEGDTEALNKMIDKAFKENPDLFETLKNPISGHLH